MKASFWSITKLKTISDTTLDCGKRWNAWNVVWVNLSLFYVLRPAVYENKFPYILLSTVYECNCTLCNFMHLYMQWYNIFHLCAYLMWSRNIKHMKKNWSIKLRQQLNKTLKYWYFYEDFAVKIKQNGINILIHVSLNYIYEYVW